MSKGQGGAGYSGPLLSRGQRLNDDLEVTDNGKAKGLPALPFDPKWAWGPEGAPKSSPNHEAMDWNIECARAALWGTAEQFERAKDVLVSTYYPQELAQGPKGIGLWTSETLCPGNHDHQHLCGTSFARVAAVVSKDRELLELSGELCRRTARLFLSLSTPDLQVWSVGLRSQHMPMHRVSTGWLRMVTGIAVPLPDLKRKPALWGDQMYASLRALRWLLKRGDDLGGAADEKPGPVPLKFAVTVYRAKDRHLAVMERDPALEGRPDVCDWIEVPYIAKPDSKKTAKQAMYGLNFEKPAPEPPKGAVIIHHPGGRGREK